MQIYQLQLLEGLFIFLTISVILLPLHFNLDIWSLLHTRQGKNFNAPQQDNLVYILEPKRTLCWHGVFYTVNTLQRKYHLCTLRKGIGQPQSQQFHINVSVAVHIFPETVHIFSCSIGRPIAECINRSQTHECGHWDWGRVILFLGIFVSTLANFWKSNFLFEHLEPRIYRVCSLLSETQLFSLRCYSV
jgi:hypothetical protein